MPTVSLQLPPSPPVTYDILIEPGLFDRFGELVRDVAPHDKCCLVVDENIEPNYGRVIARSLQAAGYEAVVAVMPVSEEHKSLGTVRAIHDVMLNAKLERKSPVIALGGGITGDVAGFIASSYLRGVPFIQVPTTLLSMVDASVGGKTGVNVPQGKNLIGAFWQPKLVVADTQALRTLPDRDLICGFAECVKHGVIRDPELFAWMRDNAQRLLAVDQAAMVELVERNVKIKAAVVADDERETGVRAHLNFGHTFAHAIEAATDYGAWPHGEAVSFGMVAATKLACDLGLCDERVLDELMHLLSALKLPIRHKKVPPGDVLLARMRMDKKVADAKIRFVLPTRIGEVVIKGDVPDEAVITACEFIKK